MGCNFTVSPWFTTLTANENKNGKSLYCSQFLPQGEQGKQAGTVPHRSIHLLQRGENLLQHREVHQARQVEQAEATGKRGLHGIPADQQLPHRVQKQNL